MKTEELAAATAEFDREMVMSKSRLLTAAERRTWEAARRMPGRPSLRWVQTHGFKRLPHWRGQSARGCSWLQGAPLGSQFWLEAVDRSKLLP